MSTNSSIDSSPDNALKQNLGIAGVIVAVAIISVSFLLLLPLIEAPLSATVSFLAAITETIFSSVYKVLKWVFVPAFNWITGNIPSGNG